MDKQSMRRKKSPGRPATGITPLVALRFPSDRIKEIDNWAGKNSVSRSEAIRRLVELGLKAKATTRNRRKKKAPSVPQPLALKMPGIQTD